MHVHVLTCNWCSRDVAYCGYIPPIIMTHWLSATYVATNQNIVGGCSPKLPTPEEDHIGRNVVYNKILKFCPEISAASLDYNSLLLIKQ